jgi:hypothetical protein
MLAEYKSDNQTDENGNPTGGSVSGTGLKIDCWKIVIAALILLFLVVCLLIGTSCSKTTNNITNIINVGDQVRIYKTQDYGVVKDSILLLSGMSPMFYYHFNAYLQGVDSTFSCYYVGGTFAFDTCKITKDTLHFYYRTFDYDTVGYIEAIISKF